MLTRRNLITNAAAAPVIFLPNIVHALPTPTGTVGNGVADDTLALQAWLNNGGGELPAGYYKTSQPLAISGNCIIRGAGKLRSGLLPGNHTCLMLNTGDSQSVQLEDFFIQYNSTPSLGTSAISRTSSIKGLIDTYRSLYISGAYDGIVFDRTVVPTLDDIYFGSIARNGVMFRNTYNPDTGDPTLNNLTFVGIGGSAVYYNAGGGMKITNLKVSMASIGVQLWFTSPAPTGDLFISNSSIEGVSYGVYLGNSGNQQWYNVIIQGCELEGTWGVVTQLGNPQWLNNVVLANNIFLGPGGMYVIDSARNVNILGGSADNWTHAPDARKVYIGSNVSQGLVGMISGTGFVPSINLGSNVTTLNPW